jgi:signal transduction histidine kinase
VTTRATRLLLTCWGAVATVTVIVELVRADALRTLGPSWTVSFVLTYVVGAWAHWAQPANRAARRLLVFGCVALTWLAVSVELMNQVRAGTGGIWFVLLNLAAQTAGLAMVCTQVATLVRYPDGVPRLATEGWSVGALAVSTLTVPTALLITRSEVAPTWVLEWSSRSDGLVLPVFASPWYVEGLGWLGVVPQTVNDAVLAVGPLLGVGVAAMRYRRLDATQRQRMAWPLLAAVLLVVGVVFNALAEGGALPLVAGDAVLIACHILLPVAMGIGIAAPGIFDALGTVRRTLPFAGLALLILATYVAVAGLLGITVGGQDLRVAVVVAVLVALALEPVRRTLVRRAGRLAFGHEVSRDELLLRLGDTLEHTLDRHALTESTAETAMEGLGAQWVLLEPDGAPTVHVGRAIRPGEKPTLISRLLHGHDDLGTISCGPADGGRARTRSRIQLETLARQVAMALTNARLADELNDQLIEVDASRQRLVIAEETARRRLERDLHDGAQQDLAALLARIALARNQLGRGDADRLDDTLATLHSDAGQALTNLHELVSGIHQATLADQGLMAAVQSRVEKLPIPVEVTCGPGVRDGTLAATVESTAYFTVCEALANTLKHGAAQRATVAIALDDGRLRIAVADDGRGFDPSHLNGSTGLTGLRDRITAVGGTLEVRSTPGRGTTLTAVIPANP